jgi:hypothetical protein
VNVTRSFYRVSALVAVVAIVASMAYCLHVVLPVFRASGFLGAFEAREVITAYFAVTVALVLFSLFAPGRLRLLPLLIAFCAFLMVLGVATWSLGFGWAVLTAIFTLASCLTLGQVLMKAVKVPSEVADSPTIGIAVGMVVLVSYTVFLGLLGSANIVFLGVVVVATGAIGIRTVVRHILEQTPSARRLLTSSRSVTSLLTLALIHLAFIAIWSAAPEVMYDAQWGKAWIPQVWASSGAPPSPISNPQMSLAAIGQMITVPSHLLGAPAGGRALQLLLLVVCGLLIWSIGKRYSQLLAAVGACVFVLVPHNAWQASTANDDLLLAFLALVAVELLFKSLGSKVEINWRMGVVAGLIAGAIVLGKFHLGILSVSFLFIWLAAGFTKLRFGYLRIVVASIFAFFCSILILFVANIIRTRSPTFPIMNALFKSPYWPEENTTYDMPYFASGSLDALARFPIDAIRTPYAFLQTAPPSAFGITVTVLAVFILFGWRRPGPTRLVWALLLFACAAWWLELRYLRYLLPELAIAVAVIPSIFDHRLLSVLRRPLPSYLVVLGVLALSAVMFISTTAQYWNIQERFPLRVVLGAEQPEVYSLRNQPDIAILRVFEAQAGKRACAATPGYAAYQQTEVGPGQCLLPYWLIRTRAAAKATNIGTESDEGLLLAMKKLGIRWVIIPEPGSPFPPVDPGFISIAQNYGDRVSTANGLALFELTD